MFLGKIDENFGSLVYGNLYKVLGDSWNCYLGLDCYIFDNSKTNQLIIENLLAFLTFRFDSILIMNIFMVLTIIISLFVFFKFFFLILQNKLISILLSAILMFSPYFYYQLPLHYELSQVWIGVLALYLFLKSKSLKNIIISGILTGLIAGISSYLFIFFNIIFLIFLISNFLTIRLTNFKEEIYYLKFKNILVFYLFNLIVSFLLMVPFILSSFTGQSSSSISFSRGVDNFIIFSSRPWYLILPSEDNPFYGEITTQFIKFFQENSGNYLFNNYFKAEHSATFLGLINLMFGSIGSIYAIKSKNPKERVFYTSVILTLVGSIFMSMPPVVKLFDIQLYLPSYLVYQIFPMTRVLSRFGIFSLLFLLILVGFAYKKLLSKQNNIKYFIILLFIISLSEFFMKINITIFNKIPESIVWVNNNTENNSSFAIYPNSKSRLTIFWMHEMKRKIVNPTGYFSSLSEFDSDKFSKELIKPDGISEAKKFGVDYIFVYSEDISNYEREFFLTNENLSLVNSSKNDEKTNSIICNNLTFLLKCNDASYLGEVYIFKIK